MDINQFTLNSDLFNKANVDLFIKVRFYTLYLGLYIFLEYEYLDEN